MSKVNPRVANRLDEIARLTKELREVLEDLAIREESPEFQKAKALFAEGWRLRGWGWSLVDTDHEIILEKNDTGVGYWADGTNARTNEAYDLLGLSHDDEDDDWYPNQRIIAYLDDLTEEADGS